MTTTPDEKRVEEIREDSGGEPLNEKCCGFAARHLGKNVYPENWHDSDCDDDLCESLGGDFEAGKWIADYFDERGQEDLGMAEDLYGEILDIPLPTPEQEGE